MARAMRLFAFALLVAIAASVDRNNFKTCDQSSFCRRLRKVEQDNSKYILNLDTLQVSAHSLEADLLNPDATFKFTLTALAGNTFRLFADEIKPLHKRYKVVGALDGEPKLTKLEVLERTKQEVVIKCGDSKVKLIAEPFKIEFYNKDTVVAVVNARGLFTIEHLRVKPQEQADGNEELPKEDPGAWEENFKSHHDSKPRGPEALAMDVTFPGAIRAYGLPEHADHLALRSTGPGATDPYRLYNLDVFEYELETTMAIYGAVPVLYAHGPENTVGVFWHNSAETWVDISNSKDTNVVSSIVNLVSGKKDENKVDAHFMSESGVLDVFVMLGPKPADVVKQYAALTGVAPLPQYFTFGYHQCRWNYNDEDDVKNVVEKFDEGDFPLDVMWLDIEYTDGKKYFTWDPVKFSHSTVMLNNLTATGRKLVAIIDPHVKRESGYFLHEDALNNDYYVKDKDGKVFEGWCWPGSSSYPDFFDPTVVDYYSNLYSLDKFKGSTENLYIWNDMNEPSVFNGPEITMGKDMVHYGNWEHRHVHNLYGLYYTMVTMKGLQARSPNKRPFILTRAFFAGSQRYAAMWTGDNAAEWSHLAISYPMCLSVALGGISFCGADIGGFFHNPDPELLLRWYQVATWLPFFRAHAHIDTKRREPYLYGSDVQMRIRNALKLRYAHLPMWYTQFWEHSRTGEPVIRPLFYEFPEDSNVLDIDNQVLIGKSVMATAVSQHSASSASVYLPGGSEQLWYDLSDFKSYTGSGYITYPVNLDKIPVFYMGGSIVSRKDRPRRASSLMHDDPYTLYVSLDNNKSATGTLYIDDSESYEYKKKKYLYIRFNYKDNTLTNSFIDQDAKYPTLSWLERVVVLGASNNFRYATLKTPKGEDTILQVSYDSEGRSLIIRKPGVSMREKFTITLH
ncbi:PREDICTED: neutral alpha-glucosidase AB [Nicrophorus vespilloides]|uniref:Glucosidase II subunit alpha n=1 Tax=Nicrophorus vespilloides TaxID=110193 RepID=A0ABM1M0Z3_NICVS|nr:PREDICTED: neutral alpha-glucosidase AB [Nicrophorus vespilloides]